MTVPSTTPVFKFVRAIVSPVTGTTSVEWAISPGFVPVSAYLDFYVEVAYSGGTFTRLNPVDPIINSNIFTDSNKYELNILSQVYYRVVMSDNGTEYASVPERVGGNLNRAQLRQATEVMRRKYIQLVKVTGVKGYLLRRKEWGTRCSCYDVDLGNVPSVTCPDCFGTGFVGGYYEAVEFWIEDVTKSGVTVSRDGQTGVEMSHAKKARCVPYPAIIADDIWVDASTGDRYKVNPESTPELWIRNVSIIEILSLEKLPPTDFLYNVPVTSDAVTGTNAWMTGFGMISYQTDMQSLSAPGVTRIPTPTPVPPEPVMNGAQYIDNLFTAGESVLAYQVVRVDSTSTLMVADAATVSHLDQVVGLVEATASIGDQIRVVNGGRVENSEWSLIPGATVYAGAAGAITQNPTGLAFVQMLGVAYNSTTIIVTIQRGVAQ